MRITYIAAGAAGSYCGACTRDVALVRGLMARGHEVTMIPLYTPLHTDGPDPSIGRVFYGGINTYLQQRSALFRKTPAFLDRLLDRPWLLKCVSRFGIETQPEKLGDMTVSVLRGMEGCQRKEVEKLMRFLERQPRPDVVNLSNSLLSAVAPEIKRRLGVPVVCTLQGEDAFVLRLPQPHRQEAIDMLRRHAKSLDMLFSPGERYADEMSEFLAVPRERVRIIRPGIECEQYAGPRQRTQEPFRIGFLSRLSPAKGFDILVEAFILLERERPDRAVLSAAGEVRGPNAKFLARLRSRLASEGLADRFEYVGEPDFKEKVRFLKNLSVFCVPTRYPEQDGIAYLEAMAAGVPVVAPEIGQLPEVVEVTGGGLLVPPENPQAIAEAIARLRDSPDDAQRMGSAAAEVVARDFSADGMTDDILAAYEELLDASAQGEHMKSR